MRQGREVADSHLESSQIRTFIRPHSLPVDLEFAVFVWYAGDLVVPASDSAGAGAFVVVCACLLGGEGESADGALEDWRWGDHCDDMFTVIRSNDVVDQG